PRVREKATSRSREGDLAFARRRPRVREKATSRSREGDLENTRRQYYKINPLNEAKRLENITPPLSFFQHYIFFNLMTLVYRLRRVKNKIPAFACKRGHFLLT
ncbi:MAG: hypothetical protein LBL13_08965, partial [Bacteroidales bacterium]|nr:hypothetical protein [Bacteroidales bacterium]